MEVLYDRFSRQAFGLAYRILGDGPSAEDVVQDAFLSVWRQSERIDAARGKLQSYVLTLVHHRAIDVLRSRKGMLARQLPDDPAEIEKDAPDFTDRVLTAIEGEAVRRALTELPDDQRQCVEMAYYQGLTHVEIAEALNLPLGTVKSRLRLALEKLRGALGAGRNTG
jgi:RNA polymerase sigma-70 factor (ECF subfamily)